MRVFNQIIFNFSKVLQPKIKKPLRLNFSLNKVSTVHEPNVFPVWFGRVFTLVFFLAFSTSLFADENALETALKSKGATIVFKATGENCVVITEGTITAEQGKSIQLLPGTHLKGEQPVKASIVSRERHEAMVKIARQETERKFFVAVFEHLKNANTFVDGSEIVGSHLPIPGGRTFFGQQILCCSALPVQTINSFSVPAFVLRNQITLKNIHNLRATAYRGTYLPDTSWGSSAENVRVMLC